MGLVQAKCGGLNDVSRHAVSNKVRVSPPDGLLPCLFTEPDSYCRKTSYLSPCSARGVVCIISVYMHAITLGVINVCAHSSVMKVSVH